MEEEHIAVSAENITIVGAGSIGTAWAIVFALSGMSVALHDQDPAREAAALADIEQRLADMDRIIGLKEDLATIVSRIHFHADLKQAVAEASLVIECIIEDVAAKRNFVSQLEPLIGPDAIIASSSSFIKASDWSRGSTLASRCLGLHPGNPPYLIRVVEVVPSPETLDAVVERATLLMRVVGMTPIHVHKEVEGFVFNRLQGALLREAYALVRDGVVTAAEIDELVRDGLGLRWSVVGPFETFDLNTRGGIAVHAERMLPAYRRMGEERGETIPAWTPETIATVVAERRAALPLEQWNARVSWRDRQMMALVSHRARRKPD